MARLIGSRRIGAGLAVALVCSLCSSARAVDTPDAKAIVDKAIKAVGGEEALGKIKAASWKTRGTITFGGNDSDVTNQYVMQDLNHFRMEFEGEFGGNKVKGVIVLAGDKGWQSFGDNRREMDKDALANQKRTVYLTMIPIMLLPLKDKEFKTEAIPEEKVEDKPVVGIKVTPPDGKDFKLYFDKESGLPVKLVAKVTGFMGEEFTQETTYHEYKEMEGVKRATKVSSKRNGEKFIEQELTEFKALDKDKVDPKTFAEPSR